MSTTRDVRQPSPHDSHGYPPGSDFACADVHDLAAPFALAAVEPEERERVERHCRRCPPCASFIDDMRQTVVMLSFAAPLAAPPPAAKAALLARIAQSSARPTPVLPAAAKPVLLAPTPTLPPSQEALAPVPEGWEKTNRDRWEKTNRDRWRPAVARRGLSRRLRPNWHLLATPLATVPLVIALGIVGLWALNTQARLNDRIAEVQQLSAQVDSLNAEVAALNLSLNSLDSFVAADNAKSYDMTPQSKSSRAYGRVIAHPGQDQAMLLVWRLSGEHARYEVLLETSGGSMVSVGELPVNNEGNGVKLLTLSQPLTAYKSVHIRPKLRDTSTGASDAIAIPDVLFATIDSNLGAPDDTDAVLQGS